jgi:hypothetical protein
MFGKRTTETCQLIPCSSGIVLVTSSRLLEKLVLRNLGVKFLGKDKQWHFGTYMFTVDFCADEMSLDTTFTEQAEEHKSFNWIQIR